MLCILLLFLRCGSVGRCQQVMGSKSGSSHGYIVYADYNLLVGRCQYQRDCGHYTPHRIYLCVRFTKSFGRLRLRLRVPRQE